MFFNIYLVFGRYRVGYEGNKDEKDVVFILYKFIDFGMR